MANEIKVSVVLGDITKIEADAIVNAANSSLMGGGGVDGAIHRAGGPQILEDCREIIARQGKCNTGDAVITSSGKLPAKYVIHTVGPVWNGGNNKESEKLGSCYFESLNLAKQYGLKSIAFPGISTGIYSFPKDKAAKIAVNTVTDFLKNYPDLQVIFVSFDQESYQLMQRELNIQK